MDLQRAMDKREDCVADADRDGEEPAAKKGRKSVFTGEHKQWILASNASLYSATSVAPNWLLRDITATGARDGALPYGATFEQVRNVLRDSFRP